MSEWKLILLLVVGTYVLTTFAADRCSGPDEAAMLRQVTARLQQQIRTYHGVAAQVRCTNASSSDVPCVAIIRDTPVYFRCDRYFDSLCTTTSGGAR